jgi:hypothetical protein
MNGVPHRCRHEHLWKIALAISSYIWIQRPDNKVHIKCRMLKISSRQTLKLPLVSLGLCLHFLAAILPASKQQLLSHSSQLIPNKCKQINKEFMKLRHNINLFSYLHLYTTSHVPSLHQGWHHITFCIWHWTHLQLCKKLIKT